MQNLGELTGARFGDRERPLLVSVRSGARASMPGMMDTVLNLGLNDETVRGLAKQTGDERFAYDAYRRFIQMYSGVVLEVEHARLEHILEAEKDRKGVELDTELDAEDWKRIAGLFKEEVRKLLGRPFPEDVKDQLWGAIGAVFGSWSGARAKTYRRIHDIPEDWGTAVNVQAMVFGNRGDTSCTGVAFTRDPSTGERALYGEFLINAQGEDVVAGIRTPQSITKRAREASGSQRPSMEEAMPEAFAELSRIAGLLETHYRDMQDMEFTVQEGRLYMLQTRTGKRTAKAALRIATEMAGESLITRDEALLRVDPASLDQMLHPMLDPGAPKELIASGLAASPGSACGEVVFTADEAERAAAQGRAVILVRLETSPEDIHGMHAAKGILTVRGGMTSHAAVVARGMGRPCVTGAGSIKIDAERGVMMAGGVTISRGEMITIDGAEGRVYRGQGADNSSGNDAGVRAADELGGCAQTAEGARQCGHAGRLRDGEAVRRRRRRPVPHRAHVFRRGAHHCRARNDPGRRCEGPGSGTGQAAADAEGRFRGDFPDHGGPARNHPSAGSSAARIHSAFG